MASCKDCIHRELCNVHGYIDADECGVFKNKADVVEVVRCKDCKHRYWEMEPEHGKTVHICSVIKAEVFKDFYCYYGERKDA